MSNRGKKTRNQYQLLIRGELYRKTPKAVFAALAVSFANMIGDGESEILSSSFDVREKEKINLALYNEWETLHRQDIIPQRPPKGVL